MKKLTMLAMTLIAVVLYANLAATQVFIDCRSDKREKLL